MSSRHLLPLLIPSLLCAQERLDVQESVIRAHMAFLADDLLEGRGMGQRGGDLAVRYLEAQLRMLGLKPGVGASYLQPVKLAELSEIPGRHHLSFSSSKGSVALRPGVDIVFGISSPAALLDFEAPVVFGGYGISAPGRGWDDFKDMDLHGKLLILLAGGQDLPLNQHQPGSVYHESRWTFKFEEAQRRGAAGVLLVHTNDGAGYAWNIVDKAWKHERFLLATDRRSPIAIGWLSEKGAHDLMQASGRSLEQLRALAAQKGFKPLELNLQSKCRIETKTHSLVQQNVIGMLPGTDPVLKDEALILSAHWDHLGAKDGKIYNGAVDNASGCAALLAIAQAMVKKPPKRTVLFLFTAGEEAGLLGAEAYIQSPAWPLAKTVADLNLESLNFAGPTRDIGLAGAEFSTLDDISREVAKTMGLVPTPKHMDPTGLFFRADHFAFVKAGIPAYSPGFSLNGGWSYLGDSKAAESLAQSYTHRYHTEKDRYDPAWNLLGMVQQAQFTFNLAQALADAPQGPTWKPGAPYHR